MYNYYVYNLDGLKYKLTFKLRLTLTIFELLSYVYALI